MLLIGHLYLIWIFIIWKKLDFRPLIFTQFIQDFYLVNFFYLNVNLFDFYCIIAIGNSNAGFRLTCRLPHCRFAAWSSLAVSELQLSAATPLWLYHRAASLPSWIEFNCLRSAAVGKAARLSINWLDAAWRCLPLGHPSAASGACAVVQISSSKRQCGKRQVSLKAALRHCVELLWLTSSGVGWLEEKSQKKNDLNKKKIWFKSNKYDFFFFF